GAGLVTFFSCVSGRAFIPLFNWPTVLLLAGAVACGLILARVVRFLLPWQGEAWRVSLEAVALAGVAVGVSFLLEWLCWEVWQWSVWLTSFSVGLYTVGTIALLLNRHRTPTTIPEGQSDGDPGPPEMDPETHSCPHCDAEFATSRGLAIHRG